MTQESIKRELTGVEALKMLLDGESVYDFHGVEYEILDFDIFQKYRKFNGKEYYVQCHIQINTFLNQPFYKDKDKR